MLRRNTTSHHHQQPYCPQAWYIGSVQTLFTCASPHNYFIRYNLMIHLYRGILKCRSGFSKLKSAAAAYRVCEDTSKIKFRACTINNVHNHKCTPVIRNKKRHTSYCNEAFLDVHWKMYAFIILADESHWGICWFLFVFVFVLFKFGDGNWRLAEAWIVFHNIKFSVHFFWTLNPCSVKVMAIGPPVDLHVSKHIGSSPATWP